MMFSSFDHEIDLCELQWILHDWGDNECIQILVAICDPFTAQEFSTRGVVVRRFLPRIDFEFSAVFPAQRSPSPVALDLVETMRKSLAEFEN